MTKLDVLDGLDTIPDMPSVTACRGETTLRVAAVCRAYNDIEPVTRNCQAGSQYRRLTAHSRCRTMPAATLSASRRWSGVPLDLISTGPDRDETIVLRHPFDA